MTREELKKITANLVGVSSSEKDIAFDILQNKVLDQLKNDGDALRIKNLGVFQFKENKENNTSELIFSQIDEPDAKTSFLRIPVKRTNSEDSEIDDIFSLSVGKPIVPLSGSYQVDQDTETSYVYIKKKIEERINEIINQSEFLQNFDLWDDYLNSTSSTAENKKEEDSQSILEDLNTSEPEPEEEEDTSPLIPVFPGESELYSYPTKEQEILEDDIFDDLETFKNIEEKETLETESFFGDETEPDEKYEEDVTENKDSVEDESPKVKFDDEKFTLSEDDIFDIDKTLFNESEDKKFDWNWGDELEAELPEEDEELEEEIDITSQPEPKTDHGTPEKENKNEEVDSDPFGTLQQTIESDSEFKMLTGEIHEDDDLKTKDEEYRITNLNKPRPVPPPQPKTHFTRVTNLDKRPPIKPEPVSQPTEKKTGYKSFRESSSSSNIFVIGGIIVILVAIIYFAFSMGDEPSKEILKSSNTNTASQGETAIVTSQPAQVVPPETDNPQSQQGRSSTNAGDNSSQVEEIRISNLIFRRGNEYNVQVSSWRSSIKAADEVKRLKSKGYKAFSVQAYLPSKGGTWHRVRIGGFKSESEARNFLNNTQL